MINLQRFIMLMGLLILISSCATRSNMVYFQDAHPKLEAEEVPEEIEEGDQRQLITIRPFDVLQIRVNTPDREINNAFRDGAGTTGSGGGRDQFYYQGYFVDNEGKADFPLIGRVQLEGLTIREAKNLLEDLISSYTPRAHVEVKFLTFKVYMFGEVNSPGLKTIPNEKSTLIEAISLGGDLTDMANRKQIKILRGDPSDPEVYEVDMTRVQSFKSPGFELKPNDIIYVEPANRKFLSMISRDFSVVLGFVNSAFILVNLYNLFSD